MLDEHNLETAVPWNRRYTVPSYSGTGSGRTAESHAGFLWPHLGPGMDLLDCGSGRGTITSGLAQLLSPGRVVGIDISEKAVERASADYSATDFGNLTFRQADVYELPFEDETFDVAFSHACLSNLQEPSRALREMWRVLRPGGVLGIRDSDDDAAVWAPVEGPMGRWCELFGGLFRANGGDPRFGRKLRGLAAQIGFEKYEIGGGYQVFAQTDETRSYADFAAGLISPESEGPRLVELGLATKNELESLRKQILAWGDRPDALAVWTWFHLLAWKP